MPWGWLMPLVIVRNGSGLRALDRALYTTTAPVIGSETKSSCFDVLPSTPAGTGRDGAVIPATGGTAEPSEPQPAAMSVPAAKTRARYFMAFPLEEVAMHRAYRRGRRSTTKFLDV